MYCKAFSIPNLSGRAVLEFSTTVPEEHFELVKDGTPGIKITPVVEGTKAFVTVETWQRGGDRVKFAVTGDGEKINAEALVKEGYADTVPIWRKLSGQPF